MGPETKSNLPYFTDVDGAKRPYLESRLSSLAKDGCGLRTGLRLYEARITELDTHIAALLLSARSASLVSLKGDYYMNTTFVCLQITIAPGVLPGTKSSETFAVAE